MLLTEGYPTAAALLCDRYAELTVRRRGGELAVRESRDGVLLGVGGEPLLIVSGRQALTTPLSAGATDFGDAPARAVGLPRGRPDRHGIPAHAADAAPLRRRR